MPGVRTPALRVAARRGPVRGVALVLHGGRSSSTAPTRPWQLAVLRMVPFDRARDYGAVGSRHRARRPPGGTSADGLAWDCSRPYSTAQQQPGQGNDADLSFGLVTARLSHHLRCSYSSPFGSFPYRLPAVLHLRAFGSRRRLDLDDVVAATFGEPRLAHHFPAMPSPQTAPGVSSSDLISRD